MRKSVVITVGESDCVLLQNLLRETGNETRFIAAGGWSSADSLARSVLADGYYDVALVVDADTNDEFLASERKRFLQDSLTQIGSSSKWKVFVVIPDIDVLLFSHKNILEAVVGTTVSETYWLEGKYNTRKVLESLLKGRSRSNVYRQQLPSIDLSPPKELPIVKDIAQFLETITYEPVA
jgi:hypothetical protein